MNPDMHITYRQINVTLYATSYTMAPSTENVDEKGEDKDPNEDNPSLLRVVPSDRLEFVLERKKIQKSMCSMTLLHTEANMGQHLAFKVREE